MGIAANQKLGLSRTALLVTSEMLQRGLTWTQASPLEKREKASLSYIIPSVRMCHFASKGGDFINKILIYSL